MAGFREFQTGEVLTAANVDDFLAKQAVMKFADAAARDTALGTAVGGGNALREGMVAYLDDEDAPSFFDGTLWSPIGNAGIGSNVVSTTKTDPFTANLTTGAETAITGLSATITPSSATSKVLVIYSVVGADTTNSVPRLATRLYRGGTQIGSGGASGSRPAAAFHAFASVADASSNDSSTVIFLDSPATTSATTYAVYLLNPSSATTGYAVNRTASDNNTVFNPRTASSITVIEVAA